MMRAALIMVAGMLALQGPASHAATVVELGTVIFTPDQVAAGSGQPDPLVAGDGQNAFASDAGAPLTLYPATPLPQNAESGIFAANAVAPAIDPAWGTADPRDLVSIVRASDSSNPSASFASGVLALASDNDVFTGGEATRAKTGQVAGSDLMSRIPRTAYIFAAGMGVIGFVSVRRRRRVPNQAV